MKKKIAILATLMLALVGIFSFALPGIAQEGTASAGKVYLVPVIYYDAGVSGGKAYNTIDVGAEKLTAEQEAEIFVENVYLAGETGSLLPEPSSDRPDWSFRGWWYTLDAEVAYTETVPETGAEDIFLYADWRNDFSLPSEPVPPAPEEEIQMRNYMRITHSDGTVEQIELFESVPDALNAYKKVQFYNEYFMLRPNDVVEFWVSGIYGDEAKRAPQPVVGLFSIQLENTAYSSTVRYLQRIDPETGEAMYINKAADGAYFRYIDEQAKVFRIYSRFHDAGGNLNVYLEHLPQYSADDYVQY